MNTSEVSTPNDTSVLVKRRFDAPVKLVWRAYVEPELFARWCTGLPGWSMPVCEMDVHTGGRYRWRWRNNDDGTEFGFVGEFMEVVTESRLVHTQIYDPGNLGGSMGESQSISTVEFQESDGITHVKTTIAFASQADRDVALSTGMTHGMEISYKKLAEIVGGFVS